MIARPFRAFYYFFLWFKNISDNLFGSDDIGFHCGAGECGYV